MLPPKAALLHLHRTGAQWADYYLMAWFIFFAVVRQPCLFPGMT
jgi:hypothetical protein